MVATSSRRRPIRALFPDTRATALRAFERVETHVSEEGGGRAPLADALGIGRGVRRRLMAALSLWLAARCLSAAPSSRSAARPTRAPPRTSLGAIAAGGAALREYYDANVRLRWATRRWR